MRWDNLVECSIRLRNTTYTIYCGTTGMSKAFAEQNKLLKDKVVPALKQLTTTP
jgi:hypothetical protein